jgi:hypothetical protein
MAARRPPGSGRALWPGRRCPGKRAGVGQQATAAFEPLSRGLDARLDGACSVRDQGEGSPSRSSEIGAVQQGAGDPADRWPVRLAAADHGHGAGALMHLVTTRKTGLP